VLDRRVDDAGTAGEIVRAMGRMAAEAGVLLCNPVPTSAAMDARTVAEAIQDCERTAALEGVRGGAVTPFLLSCLAERTGGASLETNLALLEANASLAGEVAVAAGSAPNEPGVT
jgi:pseudouridylate synthase